MTAQVQLGVKTFERWDELDAMVERALKSNILEEHDKEVLRVVASHKGAHKAIRAAEIALEAGLLSGSGRFDENSRRRITNAIESFVVFFRIPIGGLRIPPYGYFLIVSRADLDLAIQPLWGEVYSHLRRIRALTSKNMVARLFGQAMLKLDKEQPIEVQGKPKEAA